MVTPSDQAFALLLFKYYRSERLLSGEKQLVRVRL